MSESVSQSHPAGSTGECPTLVNGRSCLLVRDKAIANARLGQDILRALRVGFEFLAQLAHVDAQVLGVICIGRPPHVGEDALVGKHPSVIGGQVGQQLEFGAGQLDFFIVARDDVPGQVNRDGTRL